MAFVNRLEATCVRALNGCNNNERLLVCLFLMSERPLRWHHLSDIEKELRQMFPPSRHGNEPDTYVDFQATAIRAVVNAAKRFQPQERQWENPQRGYWRNTPLGNRRAIDVLRRVGVCVRLRGHTLSE